MEDLRQDTVTTTAGEKVPVWVRGADFRPGGVAVIGSRAASAYGDSVAASIAGGFARQDVPVYAGMAYGIDAAAHRSALAAEGYTAAILANGADIPYPSGLAGLTDSLLAGGGTLLSVYPPGTRPARKTFLERASFLASLARAVVVVEAGLASGALRIAHAAAEAGIPVFAVPGPVTSAVSAGANQLLIDGVARPAADSHDVLTRL